MYRLIIILLVSVTISTAIDTCLFSDSLWLELSQREKKIQLESIDAEKLTFTCFCDFEEFTFCWLAS